MRRFLLSTTVLVLTSGAVLAADLPSQKAPVLPPPPPPPIWSGFYAGLNAGYGFGTNSNSYATQLAPNVPVTTQAGAADAVSFASVGLAQSGSVPSNQNGFIGGGQIGYNYQYGSNIVIGIEADMHGAGIRGSGNAPGLVSTAVSLVPQMWDNPPLSFDNGLFNTTATGRVSVNSGVNWLGTVRGRLGYLWTPTMLVYGTGGLTYGGVYANVTSSSLASTDVRLDAGSFADRPLGTFNSTFVGGGNKSQTLVGWNVGGGLEWMFMPNWSFKAEGIYWNMGNMNVPTASFSAPQVIAHADGSLSTPSTTIGAARVNYQGVIARLGVNYHFNFGGVAAVVARY